MKLIIITISIKPVCIPHPFHCQEPLKKRASSERLAVRARS